MAPCAFTLHSKVSFIHKVRDEKDKVKGRKRMGSLGQKAVGGGPETAANKEAPAGKPGPCEGSFRK